MQEQEKKESMADAMTLEEAFRLLDQVAEQLESREITL